MTEPDSPIFRLLNDMRHGHIAAMEAVTAQLGTVKRLYQNLDQAHDNLDAPVAGNARIERTLRQVQSDLIAVENQNIARHGETLNLLRRVTVLEDVGPARGLA